MSDQKKNVQQPKPASPALPLEDESEPIALDPATPEAPPEIVEEIPKPSDGAVPDWAKVPADLKFPRGRQVLFLRFRAGLTDTPWKGERQAIIWPISIGDKRLALQRAQGDSNRFADEIAKQTIRACDGHRVDWTGAPGPGNVDTFWEEIGERGRTMVQRMFVQLHVPSREELRDFFENCIAVRVTG